MLFLLCFYLLPSSSKAQELFYSNPEKYSFQNGDFVVVGWSGDLIYTYRASKEGYFLSAYNDSMRLIAQVNLDFFPQKIYDVRFINYPDKIVVLYQAVQSNDVVQYAALLNDKGLLQGRPITLGSAKTGWFAGKKEYFSYAVSEDKSKIMILGWGKKDNSFTTILIDEGLNILNRSNQKMIKENQQNFRQALLSNSGELYLTTYSEVGNKGYSEEVNVFYLSPDSKKLQQKTIPLDGIYMSGLYSKLNFNNNEMVSIAFYSNQKSGNLEGVVYAIFDPVAQSFTKVNKVPFDNKLKSAADGKNKKKVFNNFEVRKIILKNDGGFLLVSENAYITSRSNNTSGYGFYSSYYYSPFGNTTIREYVFSDILVMDFDQNGDRLWFNFIRKNQYSQEDNGLFSSFAFLNSGVDIGFLFNDFSSRNSSLVLSILNKNGQVDYTKLQSGELRAGDWVPRYAKQTDVKEWIVPILKGNSLSFVRLAF